MRDYSLKQPKSEKTACGVLAAGLSSRFGSTKQVARIAPEGKTLLQNAVDIANRSKSDYVFVVLGHDSSRIMEELKLGRAQVLLNKRYKEGMSTSIRTVLSNLPEDCACLILMVADQPYVTPRLVNRLIESLRRNPKAKMAALAFENEPRNPAIFSRTMFPLLSRIRGDRGAREILSSKQMKDRIYLINVNDSRVFFDIDTAAGLNDASTKKREMIK
jgi:molybdenum cofactor cytidylyltransferase